MACSIKDFSAVAECDGDQGVIRVTDVDPLGVKAEITVYLENNGADLRKVGSRTIKDSTAKGVTVTFDEAWEPNAEYRIHVEAEDYVNEDLPILVAPADACTAEAITPPADAKAPGKPANDENKGKGKDKDTGTDTDTDTDTGTGTGTEADTSTGEGAETGKGEGGGEEAGDPSRTKTSPAPSTSDGTVPAGSTGDNAPSPEGDSNLAETGGGSHTGPIAAAAAALVALGAGAVYYSTRRRGDSTR